MRQSSVWYRESRDAWYTQVNGKKVRLAKGQGNEKEAHQAFYLLMAQQPGNLPPATKITTADLAGLFLDHSRQEHAPGTYEVYRHFLLDFCKAHRKIGAAKIKPFHLTKWLNDRPNWKGALRSATITVKAAFGWCKRQGIIAINPLEGMRVQAVNRRERVLSAEERAEILSKTPDESFRNFLTAMFETGCRLGEIAKVTAEDIAIEKEVWVFKKHKTSKKTGKDRIIYLNAVMEEMTKKLMAIHPTGPLFLNLRGKAYSRNAIRCRFTRLREKLPHLPHFTAYNVRHSFATHALVKGVGVAQVAALLGHTSTDMVNRTYSHLADQLVRMREAARQATTS